MQHKKIILMTSLFVLPFLFTGCGEKENWSDSTELGSMNESEYVEIEEGTEDPYDTFVNKPKDDFLLQFIDIKTVNPNYQISVSSFDKIWNEYSKIDESYISNWEEDSYGNISMKKAQFAKAANKFSITAQESNSIITNMEISIGTNVDTKDQYKFAALAYYALFPDASYLRISEDIETLYNNTDSNFTIKNIVNKRTISITKTTNANGEVIKIIYGYQN